VLATLANGARATNFMRRHAVWTKQRFTCSAAMGVLCYDLLTDRIRRATRQSRRHAGSHEDMEAIAIRRQGCIMDGGDDFHPRFAKADRSELTTSKQGSVHGFTEAVADARTRAKRSNCRCTNSWFQVIGGLPACA